MGHPAALGAVEIARGWDSGVSVGGMGRARGSGMSVVDARTKVRAYPMKDTLATLPRGWEQSSQSDCKLIPLMRDENGV